MTEIPEHLLKRSQSAKAKATGAPAPAEGAAPAAAVEKAATPAPAAAASAAPAKAAAPAAPKVKPDPPFVAAAKRRKKIPFWAMATLSILPVWVFMYARALTPTKAKAAGPVGLGTAIYKANCSSCHGSNGEGGVGYAFAGGEVGKTFPHIEDQLRWVYAGTAAYQAAGITVYGAPDRAGGAHNTGAKGVMPYQGAKFGGTLSELQILEVVCAERYGIGGLDPAGEFKDEYDKWCAPTAEAYVGLKDGSLTFDNIGTALTTPSKTFAVGTAPAAGHSASDKP